MNAVLGLLKIPCTMQNNPAADAWAAARVLLKEEAERLPIVVNDNFLYAPPIKMLIQKFS